MLRRDYKLSGPGEFYHIYNRGNEKRNIFREQTDYEFFIWRLAHNLFPERFPNKHRTPPLPTKAFSLISYCLMPNHFHLLLKQEKEISPSKLLLRLCTSYSMYFNKKYKRVGHLFQDQFKAVLIENNPQLMWISAYIHMNAVKDKIVKHPSEYKWSSYNDFVGKRNLLIVNKEFLIGTFGDVSNFIQQTLIYDVKGHL